MGDCPLNLFAMSYNKDIFKYQYVIAQDFIRHLAYYRQLHSALSGKSSFWTATANAHLEAAILDWCKVFGATGNNVTHWTNIPLEDVESVQNNFRNAILKTTGMSLIEWGQYHAEMLGFRDRYVAHLEIGNIPSVPFFDRALKIAFAYDKWIREVINHDSLEAKSLEELYKNSSKEAADVIRSAKGVTPNS